MVPGLNDASITPFNFPEFTCSHFSIYIIQDMLSQHVNSVDHTLYHTRTSVPHSRRLFSWIFSLPLSGQPIRPD